MTGLAGLKSAGVVKWGAGREHSDFWRGEWSKRRFVLFAGFNASVGEPPT